MSDRAGSSWGEACQPRQRGPEQARATKSFAISAKAGLTKAALRLLQTGPALRRCGAISVLAGLTSPALQLLLIAAVIGSVVMTVAGQARQGGAAAQRTPRATAPIDLTGYWVSVVTEDWRWRMVTPPK